MTGRDLNKEIEVYTSDYTQGASIFQTVAETLVGTMRANIKSIRPGQSTMLKDYGTVDPQRAIMITVRSRHTIQLNGKNHHIKYRGKTYSITTAPTNKDFTDQFISFIASER